MTSRTENIKFLGLLGALVISILFLKFDGKRQPKAINLISDEDKTDNGHEYAFSCENIESINIVRELGAGVFKKTYLGVYGDGIRVAVKMLRKTFIGRDKPDPIKMFMKEILLLLELKHKNIIKLLGFCIRSERYGTGSLKEEGMIAVYEYGEEVSVDRLIKLPLSQRLDIALEVLDLLIYLDRSPLGSLSLRDLRLRHFLVHENSLKLIDLDGDSEEPFCLNEEHKDSTTSNVSTVSNKANTRCKFSLPCVNGRCAGHNAKTNLLIVNEFLLRHLLAVDTVDLKQGMDGFKAPKLAGVKDLEKAKTLLNNGRQVTASRVRQLLLGARSVL